MVFGTDKARRKSRRRHDLPHVPSERLQVLGLGIPGSHEARAGAGDEVVEAPAAGTHRVGGAGRTIRDLMRAAEVSRSQAYRLIERGVVPFQVFAGVRYIRGEDIVAFA
jgi:hypothetical protein